MIDNKEGRGAPGIFERRSKEKLVAALKGVKGIEGFKQPSYYIKKQLAENGYLEFYKDPESSGRGRPQHLAKLTARGHATVNFAK